MLYEVITVHPDSIHRDPLSDPVQELSHLYPEGIALLGAIDMGPEHIDQARRVSFAVDILE